MVLDKKSLLECPVNVVVPQGSILGPTFFLLSKNDLHNDGTCVILLYILMILLTSLSVIRILICSNKYS